MFSSLADVLRDMRETAQAHEQWAMTPDASTSEAGTSTAFAAQIKKWLTALSESLALSASRTAQAPQQDEPIEHFWTAVERGWDIEPRAYFEKEAVPMGFKSSVEMAVHWMWKRHAKDWPNDELASAQARIQVLETSVDYLRYLVDHPVAPAEGEQ